MKKLFLLMCSVVLLAACSSQGSSEQDAQSSTPPPKQALPLELTNYAVIVMDNGVMTLKPGMKFSWKDPVAVIGADPESEAGIAKTLQTDIEKEVKRYGYGFTDTLSESPYSLVAVVILDEAKNDEDLEDFTLAFGLDPGLPKPSEQYGKGSLVIGVFDTHYGSLVWRGAVQVATDESLDKEVKQYRAERAVHALVSQMFKNR